MVTELKRVDGNYLLYDDDSIILFDKPSGMQTHGASNQFELGAQDLVRQLKGDSWSAMHRLDRDTSGMVLFGNGKRVRAIFQEQFISRTVRKIYRAVVKGEFSPKIAGTIAPLRYDSEKNRAKVEVSPEAKKAVSAFKLLDVASDHLGQRISTLGIRIYTGRTHQIRAHLSYLGYPIIGDPWYNPDPIVEGQRLLLHAQQIGFTHPITKEYCAFTSQVPEDFTVYPNGSLS